VHRSAAAQPRPAPGRERRCRGADPRPLTLPGACTRRASEAEKLSFVGDVEPLSALVKGAPLLRCVRADSASFRTGGWRCAPQRPCLSLDLVAASECRNSHRCAAPCVCGGCPVDVALVAAQHRLVSETAAQRGGALLTARAALQSMRRAARCLCAKSGAWRVCTGLCGARGATETASLGAPRGRWPAPAGQACTRGLRVPCSGKDWKPGGCACRADR